MISGLVRMLRDPSQSRSGAPAGEGPQTCVATTPEQS
jgi:hypothetical protein